MRAVRFAIEDPDCTPLATAAFIALFPVAIRHPLGPAPLAARGTPVATVARSGILAAHRLPTWLAPKGFQ